MYKCNGGDGATLEDNMRMNPNNPNLPTFSFMFVDHLSTIRSEHSRKSRNGGSVDVAKAKRKVEVEDGNQDRPRTLDYALLHRVSEVQNSSSHIDGRNSDWH